MHQFSKTVSDTETTCTVSRK